MLGWNHSQKEQLGKPRGNLIGFSMAESEFASGHMGTSEK